MSSAEESFVDQERRGLEAEQREAQEEPTGGQEARQQEEIWSVQDGLLSEGGAVLSHLQGGGEMGPGFREKSQGIVTHTHQEQIK